jgi:hypothetical protein
MLDFIFLLLAAFGGGACGTRLGKRHYLGVLEAGINQMALKCALAVNVVARESYEAGANDKIDGVYNVERWVANIDLDRINGFNENYTDSR